MALYDLESYLFRLKNDPALQKALAADPEAHLSAQAIDDDAKRAILEKDVVALWHMGVHPLLLVPLSRFLGMAPTEYRQRLQPHAGSRSFRSSFEG
ncbi:MAG: hypothetical protein EPN67_08100 [Pusillimonas sp.]|nr:MAG: hypothetical protein EPN67_08100 [Pusillimonas sp.]